MFGSYERFIGVMLEHYAGELPMWLAPVQAIVLPVSERFNEYATTVRDNLQSEETRIELDDRNESIGRKIREAELRKIPYMLVVGEREQGEGTVAVREHHGGDQGSVSVQEFAARLEGELYSQALKPRKSSERRV
jgi:threonyl-tRNA synthetase